MLINIKNNLAGKSSFNRIGSLSRTKNLQSNTATTAGQVNGAPAMPAQTLLQKDQSALRERVNISSGNRGAQDESATQLRTTTQTSWVRLSYPLFTFFPPQPSKAVPTHRAISETEHASTVDITADSKGKPYSNTYMPPFVHYSFSMILMFTSFRELNVGALQEAAQSNWSEPGQSNSIRPIADTAN